MREMKRTAEISECGKFRWWLQRRWEEQGSLVCFVMLNPSTADAEKDDPTIRRCIAFAQAWGFAALSVRNLYPFRATDPDDLKKAMKTMDVTGGDRGISELRAAMSADLVIAAWGTHASGIAAQRFVDLTQPKPIWCINKTVYGKPRHPLYARGSEKPKAFLRCDGQEWDSVLGVPSPAYVFKPSGYEGMTGFQIEDLCDAED